MWEKISDYCLDVSKYFLTAVFVTSMMQDINDVRWMLYVISGFIAIILFIAGIYIKINFLECKWNPCLHYQRL